MSNLQTGLCVVSVIVIFAVVNYHWDHRRDQQQLSCSTSKGPAQSLWERACPRKALRGEWHRFDPPSQAPVS
ncbi:hypothetical protein ACPZMI_15875 [Pseudomonas wayambapalatensis]|uniref:hypothetical protein n=2 Tax=Pseudomonas TaxID=286 RepID=UPI003CF12F93